ncbi:hypothetical protein [Blastococcus saxobsidens]|uniref:RDD family protein n=1 Tax=Blastococcus saxobsidens TaxID=138336 RepID=A0A4Q7YA36_9ACTN|nr:hypothetical protein [Blastococcus saxobsidens]RZU33414.1 hypothetical protein BKA19_3137 [Blastococcus saxobsidens]
MTRSEDYDDFYAQPLGQPAHNNPHGHAETRPGFASGVSASDQVHQQGPTLVEPTYGYAGLVKLANPLQRLGVFVIDFFGRIGLPVAAVSIVAPRFVPLTALEVWAATFAFAALMTIAINFEEDGVSMGCWAMGVRPVHAVNARGRHGVAAVHWTRLIGHDVLAVLDALLWPVLLLRVLLTKSHQTLADSWTHVVFVPFDRRTGPELLPKKEQTWRLMA